MEINQYISTRINEQITWFSKESKFNKYSYYTYKFILTASAATIPVLTTYLDVSGFKAGIGVFSIITAFLANINSLFSFKDKWLIYRSASEYLKSERYLYEGNAGKYKDNPAKDSLLVDSIENYLSNINAQWKDAVNVENDKN